MKSKINFFEDNEDVAFHLQSHQKFDHVFSWLTEEDKEALEVDSAESYAETIQDLLSTIGDFAGSVLDANSSKVNSENIEFKDGKVTLPPTITQNIEQLKELGAHFLSVNREFGGMEIPLLFELIGSELISRACPSTLLNIGWYAPIAKIIDRYGSDEIRQRFIPQLVEGSVSGSMALTEPDVGSDLASMLTYGEKQDDGSWKIFGSKQFISNGSGGLSLVLAQGKAGAKSLKTLNLYVVPMELDGKANYKVTKVEEKPGLHGSATCALLLKDPQVTYLEKTAEGFKYMLDLMNEARLAVGFQGLGLMEAVLRLAKNYAAERTAWNKPIAQHEMIAEKLLDLEAETRIFRSLLYRGSFYVSMMEIGENLLKKDKNLKPAKKKEIKEKIAFYSRKAREWTPLIKWWAGEKSYVHARTCLQIHGGYGYTTEYRPEWWVRESLILSIYEGTSEIQALMCIKDTMKNIMKDPRKFAEELVSLRVRTLAETDGLRRKYLKMKQVLNQALVKLLMKLVTANIRDSFSENKSSDIVRLVKHLKDDLAKFENLSPAMHHAARICEMKAIVTMAKSAIEDAREDTTRYAYAERFISRQYPRMRQLKYEIEYNDEQVTAQCIGKTQDEIANAAQS